MKNRRKSSNSNSLFKVELDNLDIDFGKSRIPEITDTHSNLMRIDSALAVILRQMKVAGRRERTLHEYCKWLRNYCEVTGHEFLQEITVDSIFKWLESMSVAPSTKQIRLKSLKAVLSKCHDNGWLPVKFWNTVQIKVDKKVKPAATERDVMTLLSLLDLSNFFELRDAVAILLMFRTGIRLSTLSQLNEQHFDFENGYLLATGDIMKNHQPLKLPIDNQVIALVKLLIEQNNKIRRHKRRRNSLIFITSSGTQVQSSFNNNVIQKRLGDYASEMNLQNINAHALRRGFATNLLKQGASIPLISKALGHSDIAVTTQYLYLDMETVAEELRGFL